MWSRLPAYFPNLPLRMLPLAPEAFKQLRETGWLREVAFRTQPRVNKLEIKHFLQSVYGLDVERVNTLNYQGKKKAQFDKRGRVSYYRLSDWKKAYVIFKPPPEVVAARQQELEAAKEQALEAEAKQKARRDQQTRQWQQQLQGKGHIRIKGGQQQQQQQRRQQRQASQRQLGGAVRRAAAAPAKVTS